MEEAKDIILIGGGGHAKVIIDVIRSTNQYNIIGICDRYTGELEGIPILGRDEILPKLYDQGIKNAFICVGALGNPQIRWNLYKYLKDIGYSLPVLIHRTAYVASSATIEEGTCIMPGVIINPGVQVGKMAIINTASIIEHDCKVGDNTHISPGACLCGNVRVGANTHVGAKSVINQGMSIGNDVMIGSGSVVINNVDCNDLVVGVPARTKKRAGE